jgi:hypothetical protein
MHLGLKTGPLCPSLSSGYRSLVPLAKFHVRSSVSGSWRVKTDQEFYNAFKSPDILTVIKVCRVEWVMYVVRLGGKGQ